MDNLRAKPRGDQVFELIGMMVIVAALQLVILEMPT
jgi:hypothetical protein